MQQEFDLRQIPFSRFGSFMAISQLAQGPDTPPGLYLRSVSGGNQQPIFRLALCDPDGKELEYTTQASAVKIALVSKSGAAEILFETPDAVRIRIKNLHLRLIPAFRGAYTFRYGASQRWCINVPQLRHQYIFTPLLGELSFAESPSGAGSIGVMASMAVGDVCEFIVEEYESEWEAKEYHQTFADSLAAVEQEWTAFLEKMPSIPKEFAAEFAAARQLASYIDWSCVVAPKGLLTRRSMYMSKNWMCGLWSWDHCFNALALAWGNPELAWEQFMLPFDLQHEQGALPDVVDDVKPLWAFCKPPIHGWALAKMMEQNAYFTAAERLAEAYEPLARWTQWWLRYRDPDGTGLCEYHHGNDSGWDNSTAFLAGIPLVAPDLAAFLIIQLETLADLAARLGKAAAAAEWKKRAAAMQRKLIAELWRGDQFVSKKRTGAEVATEGDSLFHFIPIVLGKRLPENIRQQLVTALLQEGRFLTTHGLATENLRSCYYDPDGYWRGPIWAASTMIIVDGLAAVGASDVADELALRFCQMCCNSGMAENYNALTGAALRDPAFTWTSSVFLCLAHQLIPARIKPNSRHGTLAI